MEVRHASFMVPEYLALARRYGVATVFADSDEYPSFADASADFVYARLMKTEPQHESGYPPDGIAAWAARARDWSSGREPAGLARVAPPAATRRGRATRISSSSAAPRSAPRLRRWRRWPRSD